MKLKHLDAWNAGRRKNAAFYDALLEKKPEYARPVESAGLESIYHIYAIRSRNRDAVLARLNANGVGAGIHSSVSRTPAGGLQAPQPRRPGVPSRTPGPPRR